MAKKKKRKRAAESTCQLVIGERLKALDDAAHSAVESIAEHVEFSDAVGTVVTGLCMSAASMVWHGTEFTEDEFVETARRCYQRIAESHSHCERGMAGDEGPAPQHHGREDLN